MPISYHQLKRAQRFKKKYLPKKNNIKNQPSLDWLSTEQSKNYYQIRVDKVWESACYVPIKSHETGELTYCKFFWCLDSEDTLKQRKAYLENLLQSRLWQRREQNRHNQNLLKFQTGGRISQSQASAAHRGRHERKRYRHQP